MADYYPLINKAVAGLDKSTGEARRALYERARTALVTQLRGVQPALSETDITRERLALEEAIRKVEAEAARKSRFDAPPERKRLDLGAIPDPFKAAAPKREEPTPDVDPDASDEPDDPALSGPAAGPRWPVRPPPPASPPASRAAEGLKEFRNVVADAENLGDATTQAGRSAREPYNAVPTPSPEFDRLEPRLEPEGLPARGRPPPPREQRREPPPRETPHVPSPNRPPPRDRPPDRDRMPPRAPGRDIPAALDSSDFGFPARHERGNEYSARDFGPPPDFDDDPRKARDTGFDHEPPPQRQPGRRRAGEALSEPEIEERKPSGSRGKLIAYLAAALVVLLVAGGVAWKWQDIAGALDGITLPFKSAGSATSQPQAPATPRVQKFDDRVRPSNTPNDNANQNAQPGADVAQRVVLYEEDPEDPAGKRFVGSAVWHTETVTRGANQPPDMVVRADIEIPERKMTMRWTLQRNVDKTLPASHTVEVVFKLPPDFAHGGVQNVPGVLMKDSEQTRGQPLAGLAVKVTDGYFLIGLSAVESEMQRNVELLKTRPWFDVPIVYTDGRRAILAVEKGTPGDRAFNDAFAAWKQ